MSLVLRVLLIDQPALVLNTGLVDISDADAWRLALGVILKAQSHMQHETHGRLPRRAPASARGLRIRAARRASSSTASR